MVYYIKFFIKNTLVEKEINLHIIYLLFFKPFIMLNV